MQRSIHLLGHSYIAASSHHTQFPLKHHQLPEAKKDKSRIHCLRFTGKKVTTYDKYRTTKIYINYRYSFTTSRLYSRRNNISELITFVSSVLCKYWIEYHQLMFCAQTKKLFDDADQKQYCECSVWVSSSCLCVLKQRFR